ncbi:sulfatase-like hydrolase/transferase [Solicola sp. PLA-1-18]|uniref:sulfatase-like hydrolase/transferase n=1 Tax=Solicola sp. PLA-1-18 TaxID=3380532 RepID=UPI003B7A9C38
MRPSSRAALWGLLGTAAVAALLVSPVPGAPTASAGASSEPPSIVMIHMDDVSTDLVRTMPELRRLAARSARFRNAFVADSLCCTSRASTFTGQYPHNTGVRTNYTGPDPSHPVGGYAAFEKYGNLARSFNVALHGQAPVRYDTAIMGKYVNAFGPRRGVPPGWTTFEAVLADGYQQYGYRMTKAVRDARGRRVLTTRRYGTRPQDYGTTVQERRALRYVRTHERRTRPYYLQISTYAAHARTSAPARPGDPQFVPAPRDLPGGTKPAGNCGRVACGSLDAGLLPGYGDRSADNAAVRDDGTRVAWRGDKALTPAVRATLTKRLRNRAQMVQAVDRMIGKVRRSVGPNTYVVITSDNGYRLGQLSMPNGKATPYDADVRVPLIVSGPGVRPGTRDQVVSNVDLASTFEQIAGVAPRVRRDGRSFLDVLRDPAAVGGRVAFFEHRQPASVPGDPDKESSTRLVPSYVAARSADALLVKLDLDPGPGVEVGWEFYRGLSRPGGYEATNTYTTADPTVRWLQQRIAAFEGCSGVVCRTATL